MNMFPVKHRIFTIFFIIGLSCLPPTLVSGGQPAAYVIAVLPQQSPVAMHENWSPFLERLTRETGIIFKLKLYETMAAFEKDALKGIPDLIFSTPPIAVLAHQKEGYKPLVRGSRETSGVLFVAKDSPIQSVKELEGKEISFVGSRNVCSILVRSALDKDVRIGIKKQYQGSTANVIKSVLIGKAQAGATLDQELAREAQMFDQVRILLETPKFPPHPISAHPRLPKKVGDRIAAAVIRMHGDEAGKKLLKTVRMSEPVRADYNRDYRRLENIDIVGLSQE